jgi:hypothetical protein
MKTLSTYVKLLGKMDHRREAWKTSRPKFTEENLNFEKVEEMDLSLNSMLVYTFEMRSSVYFRDLIFSLRPLEGWALSTRSMPINRDTICLSSEFAASRLGQAGIDEMFSKLERGVSRDHSRDVLPLSVSSTYTFTMDYRVLISFCKNIEILNSRLWHQYCLHMLNAAGITVNKYRASTVRSSLEYYRINEAELIKGKQQMGNVIHGHYKMKMALASQFLRQHYSKIKIGLWNIVPEYYYYDLRQHDIVDVVFYIDINSYHRLMAMRSHWVLDHSMDMWGTMVGDYIKNMTTKQFWNFTPAGGNKTDPYWADCYNRVLLEDPGVPCPIMTEWPGAITERRKETPDSPVLDMYEKLFDEGFIKDNPDNEHRIKYFNLLEKKND